MDNKIINCLSSYNKPGFPAEGFTLTEFVAQLSFHLAHGCTFSGLCDYNGSNALQSIKGRLNQIPLA